MSGRAITKRRIGNLSELHQGQAAVADFEWQTVYGGIARIKAPFGVRCICPSIHPHIDGSSPGRYVVDQ